MRIEWKLIGRIIFTLLGLFLLFVGAVLLGPLVGSRDHQLIPTGDTLKIIGDTEYLMPSAYIWLPGGRWSGKDKSFVIDAFLPDLAPIGVDNAHIS